ncbi:MAG: IS256 family transposase, partial [Actinomycetales bacterium]|nr:IS256 family transposase [Actinomycetales bacterium]
MSKMIAADVTDGEVVEVDGPAAAEVLSVVDGPLIDDLVARARQRGLDLTGPEGLLTALTKRVLESAL